MELTLLFELGTIIIVSALLAYLARFFKQPAIVAYVIAGFIIGPSVIGVITNITDIDFLSNLGIVFLLFSVGLEIDFRKFKNVGFVSLVGGGLQMLLTFMIGLGVASLFGLDSMFGVYFGLLLAFSSTMIVTKLLVDRDEINTLHGRIMLAILLFQDVVAIVAIPLLSDAELLVSIDFVAEIVLKGVGFFSLAILMNKFFFPRILDYAAQKRELFFITAVANCFFFIGAAHFLDFSIAIGGFIAGLSMANFPYNIEIAGETRALRDFFSIIFFASLGMQLNFMVIQNQFSLFLVLLLITLLLKPLILGMIYLFLGYGGRTSTYIGLGMGQSSEFVFIIALTMFQEGAISGNLYSLLLSIVVVSIVITPYLERNRNRTYTFFSKIGINHPRVRHWIHPKSIHELENRPEKEISNHIVLFGAHRMGERIVDFLKQKKEKIVIIDRDPEIVKDYSQKRVYCIYGDADNEEILKKAFLSKAKLIILTIPYSDPSSFVIRKAKRINPSVKIIARAHYTTDAERLYKSGADVVVIPEYVSAEKIVKKIDHYLK